MCPDPESTELSRPVEPDPTERNEWTLKVIVVGLIE